MFQHLLSASCPPSKKNRVCSLHTKAFLFFFGTRLVCGAYFDKDEEEVTLWCLTPFPQM